ncbi:MAG: hypothetical protein GDA53_10720 [Rhodobacteraceae bacterium]|nr:hypothetical protein [Paracoccaceae bacterium]
MTDRSPIVFADLDDTLFQTMRKMSGPAHARRLAARAANGSHSYMTEAQAATVRWLLDSTRLIPTTARSSEVLAQATIRFTDYKICSNGGAIITPDGAHDRTWAARTAGISARHAPAFSALQDAVSALVQRDALRCWLVCEAQIPVYFVAKISVGTPRTVLDEAEWLCRARVGTDLVFHRNGRNLSFTPKGLAKSDAVKELLRRLPDTDRRPIWGMGDSISDLPFMRLCQMMVAPANSQITKTHLEI